MLWTIAVVLIVLGAGWDSHTMAVHSHPAGGGHYRIGQCRSGPESPVASGGHHRDHRKVSDMNTRTLLAIILIAVGSPLVSRNYHKPEKAVDSVPST
jgi:hypothetical protein